MTLKNKVIVRIYGQEHTLKSDDSREYMQRVANLVDDKMNEIASANKKLSTSQLAVLTALNMTDEYLKILDMFEDIKSKLDNPDVELKRIEENLKITQSRLNEKSDELDRVLSDYNKLLQESSNYDNLINELKIQNDELSSELISKSSIINESEMKMREKDALINRVNMEKDALKKQVKSIETQLGQSQTEYELKLEEIIIKDEELSAKTIEAEELADKVEELQTTVKFNNDHILALKKELDIKNSEITEAWTKYDETQKELEDFIQTFDTN